MINLHLCKSCFLSSNLTPMRIFIANSCKMTNNLHPEGGPHRLSPPIPAHLKKTNKNVPVKHFLKNPVSHYSTAWSTNLLSTWQKGTADILIICQSCPFVIYLKRFVLQALELLFWLFFIIPSISHCFILSKNRLTLCIKNQFIAHGFSLIALDTFTWNFYTLL